MLTTATTIDPEQAMLGEVEMDGRDWWEEIHRRAGAGASIRAIARELDLDRKTVHRCLRQAAWRPYQRAVRQDTLLAAHAAYLRQRAAEVGYSARVLFQLALPLWPEDASALVDGTVVVEVDVEALGMPRSRDMREVLDARSIEDAARRLLWLALNFDEMAVRVDGLVNGGPVFEVREVVP